MSRYLRAAFAAIALTVVVAAPSSAVTSAGGIGLRLLDAPATATNDPRALLYIVDHIATGTVIQRRIEISNTTTSVAHIFLYPSAATIEEGAFLGSAGHTPNDLSTWTSIRPGTVDVAAGGLTSALVTIDVPENAAPGERYGVVWAETRSTPTSAKGVTQANRVGVRLYVSIGPGGAPAADFTIESLTAKRSPAGLPMILATVRNTGGRALDMNGTLKLLDGPGGLSAGPFPATLGTTLAIGDRESVKVVLDASLPAGPWDARIELGSGSLQRSARATLAFPATGAAPPVSTEADQTPLLVVVGGLIAVLLLGLLYVVFHEISMRVTRP